MNERFEKLFSFPGRGVKTFDAMRRLDEKLGFPHRSFKSIHIGGTNGKGSVAWKTARALQLEGFRVGLYTSPHISHFGERIRVDGEVMGEGEADDLLRRLLPLVSEELSFFDLLTAMAFLHFQERRVDWAVVEVGLGGRLDATNVIHPEAIAITSIGYDHMQILGDTLEEIAREKRGIVKPGAPLVAGPSAAPFFPEAEAAMSGPFYDLENQNIARALLKKIGIASPKGLEIRPPCRFERRGNAILDVAHNPDGFQKLIEALDFHFPGKKFPFLVAFSREKEWQRCIDLIAKAALRISAVRGAHKKLIAPEEIASYNPNVQIAESFDIAEPTVVAGSFYIMEEVMRAQSRIAESFDIAEPTVAAGSFYIMEEVMRAQSREGKGSGGG